MLTVALKEVHGRTARLKVLFNDNDIDNKTLKPHFKVVFVAGQHQLAALQELSALDRPFPSKVMAYACRYRRSQMEGQCLLEKVSSMV